MLNAKGIMGSGVAAESMSLDENTSSKRRKGGRNGIGGGQNKSGRPRNNLGRPSIFFIILVLYRAHLSSVMFLRKRKCYRKFMVSADPYRNISRLEIYLVDTQKIVRLLFSGRNDFARLFRMPRLFFWVKANVGRRSPGRGENDW